MSCSTPLSSSSSSLSPSRFQNHCHYYHGRDQHHFGVDGRWGRATILSRLSPTSQWILTMGSGGTCHFGLRSARFVDASIYCFLNFMLFNDSQMYLRNWLWWLCKFICDVCRRAFPFGVFGWYKYPKFNPTALSPFPLYTDNVNVIRSEIGTVISSDCTIKSSKNDTIIIWYGIFSVHGNGLYVTGIIDI